MLPRRAKKGQGRLSRKLPCPKHGGEKASFIRPMGKLASKGLYGNSTVPLEFVKMSLLGKIGKITATAIAVADRSGCERRQGPAEEQLSDVKDRRSGG